MRRVLVAGLQASVRLRASFDNADHGGIRSTVWTAYKRVHIKLLKDLPEQFSLLLLTDHNHIDTMPRTVFVQQDAQAALDTVGPGVPWWWAVARAHPDEVLEPLQPHVILIDQKDM